MRIVLFMETINYLLYGSHPKTGKIKERTIQIIKALKANGGKIEATKLEEILGISRNDKPSMFYRPLAVLKKWNLVVAHKSVVVDEQGKKHFKTEYEFTPQLFDQYLEKTFRETVKKELETV